MKDVFRKVMHRKSYRDDEHQPKYRYYEDLKFLENSMPRHRYGRKRKLTTHLDNPDNESIVFEPPMESIEIPSDSESDSITSGNSLLQSYEPQISLQSSPNTATTLHLSECSMFEQLPAPQSNPSICSDAAASQTERNSIISQPERIDRIVPSDSIDCFGLYVAAKLREMDPDKRTITERDIIQVLFR